MDFLPGRERKNCFDWISVGRLAIGISGLGTRPTAPDGINLEHSAMLPIARSIFSVLLLALGIMAHANGPVTWSFSAVNLNRDTVQVQLHSNCEAGWHIYALSLPTDEGPLPTVVKVDEDPAYKLAGPPSAPEPVVKMDPAFGVMVRYYEDTTTFMQELVRASQGPVTVRGAVEYMACNDKTCLPPTRVEFKLDIPPVLLK
jgi:thiol:disulfide interchange protein DsbD